MVERFASITPGNNALRGLRSVLEHTGLYGLLTPVPGATPPHEADAVLLPSSLIRLLWEADRRHCRSALGMDVVKLRSFWEIFWPGQKLHDGQLRTQSCGGRRPRN